jgi:hypothetical protein
MKTPKQNTKPSLISAFKKQIPSSQAQQTKLMKNSYLIRSSAFSVALLAVSFLASNSARAAVVAMIDPKIPSAGSGVKDITHELGFSSSDMQTLITTTNDLTMAGVLDSEGTWPDPGAGTFENEIGVLSGKITGATRYGRQGNIDVSASGSRWGYVESTETWTPDVLYIGPYSNAGLTHFGLITSSITNRDRLTVTVTYSDATTESLAGVKDQTNWLGFHKDGEIITSIQLDDNNQATSFTWANYDDVSLVFSVPEPSSTALLGLGGLALVLRRKRS